MTNKAVVRVVRHGRLERVQSKDVRVGDILAVKDKEKFPCDLVLLATHSLQGKCYVMTANLDGESNLKPKFALRETRKYMSVSFLKNLSGEVECLNPSPDLFSFSGRVTLVKDYGVENCPIGLENLGKHLCGLYFLKNIFVVSNARHTAAQHGLHPRRGGLHGPGHQDVSEFQNKRKQILVC